MAALLALGLQSLCGPGFAQSPPGGDAGERIYRQGQLGSGAALVGRREGRGPLTGAAAACVQCHRNSGMGQVEGDQPVPPISGPYLFAPAGDRRVATMDPHVSKRFNRSHDPYTDALLQRAIREGVNVQGRTMSVLMPRFELPDADLDALVRYLHGLSAQWSPGVGDESIEIATVITPEVNDERRKVFRDMMQDIVRRKNASTVVASQKGRNRHHMVTAAELVLGTERTWNLQVWELHGAPDTWGSQLDALYRARPVFALVSGLSDTTWKPVQDFCDGRGVPCWFPSVPCSASVSGPQTLYFSEGLGLEAKLLEASLAARGAGVHRIVQVYRRGEAGEVAAQRLHAAFADAGVQVDDVELAPASPADRETLGRALARTATGERLVLWLRPSQLAGVLEDIAPPGGEVYLSATLGWGVQAGVPPSWRGHTHLLYPYELPALRRRNLDYFQAWIHLAGLPLIDEAMQSEVFFAMNFFSDTVSEMLDNLYRDYLVERAEQMIERRERSKSEQESRERMALGREGDLLQRRGPMTVQPSQRIALPSNDEASYYSRGTTLYPHLSLAAGQRVASKSGYVARFVGPEETDIEPETALLAP